MTSAGPFQQISYGRIAPDHMKVDTYGKPYLHTFLVGKPG